MTVTAMTSLQNLVKDRRAELGLSYRGAADRSGGLISHTTLQQVETGGNPARSLSDDTLHGIALALDLPISKVRESAGEPKVVPQDFKLPKRANRLTPEERKSVLAMMDALLAHHRGD